MPILNTISTAKFESNNLRGKTLRNVGKPLKGTDGQTFAVASYTTAERDALDAVNGMIIYNKTTNAFNFYENGSWVTK